MIYTIEQLLANPVFIQTVINRAIVTMNEMDRVLWPTYLDPAGTNPDGTFKTFSGNVSAVIVGSFIDKNAKKPVRSRKSMSKGMGEVGDLGESYQMDNDRLDQLQVLVDTLNRLGRQEDMEAIVNFLVDVFRQCYLAPNKRMDLMLFDLMFTGKASVRSNVDGGGVKINEITLPFKAGKNKLTPTAGDKNTFISWLLNALPTLRQAGCDGTVLKMSRTTFTKYIAGCAEFKESFLTKVQNFEVNAGTALISPTIVNNVFDSLQIPFRISLDEALIRLQDDTILNAVPDNKIAILPSNLKVGKLRHKRVYEMGDQIPGKSYVDMGNDLFIATQRTEEGRFMEYGCKWIVDVDQSNRMGLLDLSAFSG